MAEPAPHHEAINVIDNAQKGSVLPAKKKSSVFLLFFSRKTINNNTAKYTT